MSQDGPHRLLPRSALANTAALFLCYWLAWKAAAVFEVQPHVSALYLSAGLSTAVGMIGGWRYLPAAFVAICVVRQLDMPGALLEGIDWGGALRQVLVYGGTGVLLRRRWLAMPARLTLTDALHFVLLAFAAAFFIFARAPGALRGRELSGPASANAAWGSCLRRSRKAVSLFAFSTTAFSM